MTHQVEGDRYNISLIKAKVREVLPQYFTTDYPNLITFLESYYEYVDSDETVSVLSDLFGLRDVERATLTQLDQIFEEIASGASRDYFTDSREVLRNFAKFYRVKGTRYSAEGFFRAFYNEDVEIQFPKNNIFIVGDSKIGAESLKFLTDGALYQIFSVLLKSAIPISTWQALYKRFVHPAGFYLGGEVIIEGTGFTIPSAPIVIADSAPSIVEGSGLFAFAGFDNHIGIIPDEGDLGGGAEYIGLNRRVSMYQNFSVTNFGAEYGTIQDVIQANSHLMDEDSAGIRMDNSAETMDRDLWQQDSINNSYMFPSDYVASDYVAP